MNSARLHFILRNNSIMKNLIFIVWAAMALPSAYAGRVTAPEGKTYVYKETNGVSRELEIYFPKAKQGPKKPVPGIIMFHGAAGVEEPGTSSVIFAITLRAVVS